MKRFPIFLLLVSGLVCAYGQKNVLVIMVDDFNHWISPVGYYQDAITPHINQLASQGVLFRDASSPSPVCNPSRNAIWSGLRSSSSGISDNQDGYIREKPGLADIVTMNQLFTDHGYFTYAGGKIYHPSRMGDVNTDPTHWSSYTDQRTGSNGGQLFRWTSDVDNAYTWGAGNFNLENANDRILARHFAEQITNYNGSQPFFFAVGFFRPHLPWNCHQDFFNLYDPDTLDLPAGYLVNDAADIPVSYNGTEVFAEVQAENQWKNAIRAYLANMSFADSNVGIVLDALSGSPSADSTIVVFMGDHGWHLGEKDRLSKHAVFDEASRTTFIIYDPTATGNGQTSQKVVSLQDVYPTLASLTGLPLCEHVEGNDLSPLLESPNDSSWEKAVLMTYRGTDIIKTNAWRFIEGGNNSQLYDIVSDPYEFTNLYGQPQHATTVNTLRGQIQTMKIAGQQSRGATCSVTGLEETPGLLPLRMFPNPTAEVLLIEGLGHPEHFQVSDAQGSVVMRGEISSELKLEGLSPGVYVLQIVGYSPVRFVCE